MTATAVEKPGKSDASVFTVITLEDFSLAVAKRTPPRKVPVSSERPMDHARRLLAKRRKPLPRDNPTAIRVLEHLRRIGIAPPPPSDSYDQPADLDGGD